MARHARSSLCNRARGTGSAHESKTRAHTHHSSVPHTWAVLRAGRVSAARPHARRAWSPCRMTSTTRAARSTSPRATAGRLAWTASASTALAPTAGASRRAPHPPHKHTSSPSVSLFVCLHRCHAASLPRCLAASPSLCISMPPRLCHPASLSRCLPVALHPCLFVHLAVCLPASLPRFRSLPSWTPAPVNFAARGGTRKTKATRGWLNRWAVWVWWMLGLPGFVFVCCNVPGDTGAEPRVWLRAPRGTQRHRARVDPAQQLGRLPRRPLRHRAARARALLNPCRASKQLQRARHSWHS